MSIDSILQYTFITLGVALLLLVPILSIRFYLTKGKLKNGTLKHELANIFFIFYLLCLYQITALRFGGIGWNLEEMLERNTRVNSEPLVAVCRWIGDGRWWHFTYNVIGNCIWFMPLGFLMPAIYKHYREKSERVIFIGMVISASIEVLQYFLCTGVTDIDDVIFNTIGTAIGYLLWVLFDKIRCIAASKE